MMDGMVLAATCLFAPRHAADEVASVDRRAAVAA